MPNNLIFNMYLADRNICQNLISIYVSVSSNWDKNRIKYTNYYPHTFLISRLFYAGAVEGQMPEILSMIQVNKMTPAPAVLVVVRFFLCYKMYCGENLYDFNFLCNRWDLWQIRYTLGISVKKVFCYDRYFD